MNYLLDKNIVFKNKRPAARMSWIGVIVGIVLVLYVGGPFISRLTDGLLSSLARPILERSQSANGVLFRTVHFFRTHKSLVFEVERLRAENNTLTLKNTANQALLTELVALQAITDRRSAANVPIVGRVFDRPPQLAYDTLLVDVGRRDSEDLQLGSLVFIDDEVLIGEVVQIFSQTTKIKLYSSPGTKLGVTIGPGLVAANAEGIGNGNFMIKLPRGIALEEGAMVFSAGAKSHLIGVVGGIDNDPRNPLQTVYVTVPININAITWVEITR